MEIKSFYRYKLLKSDVPTIIKKVIVKDVNVGGIKLQYEVTVVKALVFMFLNKMRIIPITRFPKKKEILTFLRPYKENWSKKRRDRMPKNFWGNNDEPLTSLWIELESDYKSLDKGLIILKKEIRNTEVTKHLFKQKPVFFVIKKY